ncbi:GNAT family N-acetyltransferase [Cupriavidus sp. TMH.W2]|uniref:GNAT family N-acetyltransferase n=1 Tax=Cupriavidus sp. TMH.W2 TaxID=3434465 RepID=UPI003D779BDE
MVEFDSIWLNQADQVTDEIAIGISDLLNQLSSRPRIIDKTVIDNLLCSSNVHILLAISHGQLIGMLTLANLILFSGQKALIEDVVVTKNWRGKGIADRLVRSAIEKARDLGATKVDLTSRPDRLAANRLYERCGFERRDTNSYRLNL